MAKVSETQSQLNSRDKTNNIEQDKNQLDGGKKQTYAASDYV